MTARDLLDGDVVQLYNRKENKMTIKELRTEIEQTHRAWYPEDDARVWPLCLAKLVEEWDEFAKDGCEIEGKEDADVCIVSLACVARGYYVLDLLDALCSHTGGSCYVIALAAGIENDIPCPDWLESRWNEVKQRTPSEQRARDKERGIDLT